ncbi:hypothetical protein [Novosphingobium sp. P6W]|uniref:hypothetical protein n=1 Tax=Novosphingobium sp. P6W TaxID=1609758 RepID=UPI0005C2A388|nr:hypothetical protein [Novosphingobium sp. P6W]AXB75759.1 hypothetical protein TQ38_003860 [Novosphingobium sp. P6W]KIS33029.1 hypothetical protein TQ38_06025 [Novosphingobium sp. P6W]
MRIKAGLAIAISGAALMLAACDKGSNAPTSAASMDAMAGAAGAVVDDAPSGGASSAVGESGVASTLDMAALNERRDPERLLRYYVSAIRVGDWVNGARAWSLDAEMTPAKLEAEFGGKAGPKLAVGKGDMEGAAGSLYYEAPLVVDFGDGRPSKRGTIVLRRVNDVPGASGEQLNWRIERTSTLTQ